MIRHETVARPPRPRFWAADFRSPLLRALCPDVVELYEGGLLRRRDAERLVLDRIEARVVLNAGRDPAVARAGVGDVLGELLLRVQADGLAGSFDPGRSGPPWTLLDRETEAAAREMALADALAGIPTPADVLGRMPARTASPSDSSGSPGSA